jgi:hypothetical protein
MTPHQKQVMMFSATLAGDVRPVCKKFMSDVSRRRRFDCWRRQRRSAEGNGLLATLWLGARETCCRAPPPVRRAALSECVDNRRRRARGLVIFFGDAPRCCGGGAPSKLPSWPPAPRLRRRCGCSSWVTIDDCEVLRRRAEACVLWHPPAHAPHSLRLFRPLSSSLAPASSSSPTANARARAAAKHTPPKKAARAVGEGASRRGSVVCASSRPDAAALPARAVHGPAAAAEGRVQCTRRRPAGERMRRAHVVFCSRTRNKAKKGATLFGRLRFEASPLLGGARSLGRRKPPKDSLFLVAVRGHAHALCGPGNGRCACVCAHERDQRGTTARLDRVPSTPPLFGFGGASTPPRRHRRRRRHHMKLTHTSLAFWPLPRPHAPSLPLSRSVTYVRQTEQTPQKYTPTYSRWRSTSTTRPS